jgi:hypothetical protein
VTAGTCSITASQAGNANYTAATPVSDDITISKASQTITITSSAPAATVGGPTYTVAATASSGLAVTFTIDASASAVCSISGVTVSFVGIGTCKINADQAGDGNYNAAPQTQQTFTASAGNPAQLVFVLQPTNGTAGVAINTVTVEVRDAQGNVVTTDNNSVTLSVTGPGPFDPTSTMTVNALNGVATFNNLIFDVAGTGYKLTADDSADSLTSAASNAFNIAAGTATQLVFTQQPNDVNAGSKLNTIAVQEEDASGNFVNDNGNVDFTVPACGGSIDLGSKTMVNGAASLTSSQRFYTVTGGLQITATATAASGTSTTFSVVPADMLFSDGFEGCRL